MDETERQTIVDGEHLKALAIGYFALGAMAAFTALMSLIYIAMGIFMGFAASRPEMREAEQGAVVIAALFALLGLGMLLGFGTLAALQLWTGVSLLKGRRRTLGLVTAGLTCLWLPFGTVLAAFTFLVLLRPSVAFRFRPPHPGPPVSPGAPPTP